MHVHSVCIYVCMCVCMYIYYMCHIYIYINVLGCLIAKFRSLCNLFNHCGVHKKPIQRRNWLQERIL